MNIKTELEKTIPAVLPVQLNDLDLDPEKIKAIMINEVVPSDPSQDANWAAGAQGSASQAPAAPSGDSGGPGGAQPSSTSFKGLVDTKVSVTFPGAVTQSGGGKVSGTTVTWDDPDTVAKGVNASGYAQDSRGVPWWTRSRIWLTAGLALLGGVLTVAVLRRRSSGRAPRKAASGRH